MPKPIYKVDHPQKERPMLTTKLLRIEENIVEKLEEMVKNLSQEEYTSFSSLVRKLIRIGLRYMEVDEAKDKRVSSIPRFYYSQLFKDGYSTLEERHDSEIENMMSALNCMHGVEEDCAPNHLTIAWRTSDEKGEHSGIGILAELDALKPGDEIVLGLPNVYKLVVMSKATK
jgi:hypothetical protein